MNRRLFIKNTSLSIGIGSISGISLGNPYNNEEQNEITWDYSNKVLDPSDEAAWEKIGAYYPRESTIINLENGYFSHQALPVLAYHQQMEKEINSKHSIFMRLEQEARIESIRDIFASYQNCKASTIAFTRNTTESLNIAIMGFPWTPDDEVIIGNQDYGSMVEAFEQCVKRFAIRIKIANIPITDSEHFESTVMNSYTRLITPKTRMIHLTHPVNLNGQGLPLLRLIEKIRDINSNICIVVDAAHAVSHFPEKIGEIPADIIGCSLHKWTGNPLGLGCLYMRENWIPKIWPLMGDISKSTDDIRKFEHQGTRPIQSILALEKAIAFNLKIGLMNRLNRLRYLKYTWQGNQNAMSQFSKNTGFQLELSGALAADLTQSPKIDFLHPLKSNHQGAISTFCIKGMTPDSISKILKDRFKIFTVAINHPIINGVRITPQLSNSKEDALAMNKAIHTIISES